MMRSLALMALLAAVPVSARMARPTTGPAMQAAFPDFDIKTNQAAWHRESGKGPKGIFLPAWRTKQLQVSPRALIDFADGKMGLVVGGTGVTAGQPEDCHACSGLLSFIPVGVQNHAIEVTGPARDIGEEGDWGVPGSVTPVLLAANASGIVVISSGGGQGYSVTVLRAWQVASSGVSKSLTPDFISLASDTSGVATGCDGKRKLRGHDCWSIDGRWRVEGASGRLVVDYSGMRNGQKVAAQAVYGLGPKGYRLVSGRNPMPEV